MKITNVIISNYYMYVKDKRKGYMKQNVNHIRTII